jgi:putative DNA primase/helicase
MLKPRTLVRDVAGAITERDRFARNRSNLLYVYREGVYRPDGELFVRQRVKHVLLDNECSEMWSRTLAKEVIEFITLDVPELMEQPSTELINLLNGVLNVRTRELFAHSPEFLSTIRIPIAYDPTATCPAIDKFIGEVFCEDSIPLAWEILGDLITPDRSVQKAICIVGEGGNGKSAFLDLAGNFIGTENVCHLSLHRLEADRFATSRLYGKLANICTDLPSERLTGSAMFKAITGCDRITAEIKYRDSFEFAPFARLLFSANRLPTSNDVSRAFLDRWLIVPFDRRFRYTRSEIPRNALQSRLCAPRELSGALNKALEGLERVRKCCQFSGPNKRQDSRIEDQTRDDILPAWLNERTTPDDAGVVPQSELHNAYEPHCQ